MKRKIRNQHPQSSALLRRLRNGSRQLPSRSIQSRRRTNQSTEKLQEYFLTPMRHFEADLYSCDCVILDDPRVDVLHVGLNDVVIHVVDRTNDAFTKSIFFLYSRIVIESKEVAIFIFQEFVLLPFIE